MDYDEAMKRIDALRERLEARHTSHLATKTMPDPKQQIEEIVADPDAYVAKTRRRQRTSTITVTSDVVWAARVEAILMKRGLLETDDMVLHLAATPLPDDDVTTGETWRRALESTKPVERKHASIPLTTDEQVARRDALLADAKAKRKRLELLEAHREYVDHLVADDRDARTDSDAQHVIQNALRGYVRGDRKTEHAARSVLTALRTQGFTVTKETD